MQSSNAVLVGSILEREPTSTPSVPTARSGKTGFPAAQHRSKSAFARSRDDLKKSGADRSHDVPKVASSSKPRTQEQSWRGQIDTENQLRVAAMSDEERDEERREILERFGPGVGEILKRAKAAREVMMDTSEDKVSGATNADASPRPHSPVTRPSTPPSALSRSSTRPSSRAGRKLRFADVTPNDVYVYESAPSSPRRKPIALPAPSDLDGPTISLGEWNGWKSKASAPVPSISPQSVSSSDQGKPEDTLEDLEAGTPEDIRRRFFPSARANDPSLAWMEPETSLLTSSTTVRFDLSGTPISPDLVSTLPTHLGLHHHSEGTHAGYTLDDIFLLSRSTVPGQRASMLGILCGIARRLAKAKLGNFVEGIPDLAGQEESIRKRIIAAGVEIMGERGGLGARAIEAMWECIVGWDLDLVPVEGIELQSKAEESSNSDALSSLPLDYMLPHISAVFSAAALPSESLSQLLAIVHRLAQHSNRIASSIVSTPSLVAGIVQRFLLTPIPPDDDTPLPDPAALQLLITLVSSSRQNALAILGPTDALLRFVTTLPHVSPFPLPLATALLTDTLRLYASLAAYGLYAQIATTAVEHLTHVSAYVHGEECKSAPLREAWLRLLGAWMVCARDPHHTTPSHDILWSQVVGWDWGEEVLALRPRLGASERASWAALWCTKAAWLEGARISRVRSGDEERALVLDAVHDGFRAGVEMAVVESAGKGLENALSSLASMEVTRGLTDLRAAAGYAEVLAAALRFWLSCLPTESGGSLPPQSPPFYLPFPGLSDVCRKLTTHPLWDSIFSDVFPSYAYVYCRPFSVLLATYLRVSRRIPGASDDLWLSQAFAIICRLLPGDEESAQAVAEGSSGCITAPFMDSRGWSVPAVLWENGGLKVIKPILMFSLQPKGETYIAPLWATPRSLSSATTQRLPPVSCIRAHPGRASPLPLPKDWLFSPLDHLLRSGQSEAFKSMPSWWNASEPEIIRATLLYARVGREVLRLHGPTEFMLNREESIFACMKVFMLEHEQQQTDSTGEVFRDQIVGQFMDELVAPFAAGMTSQSLSLPAAPSSASENLEAIAVRFLGPSTPFYQFYTDFVALYDAVSFSHPLFARLLLAPVSMRYPLDYRKYLWGDYKHILKTIRTPIQDVLIGSIGEYLWPLETDAHVLGSYLGALVRGSLDGFLRFVAVHHVASNIWPDLHEGADDRSQKLLHAVVDQGSFDVVRDVVSYRQEVAGTILIPPVCFAQKGGWKASRRDFLGSCSAPVRERVAKLLE